MGIIKVLIGLVLEVNEIIPAKYSTIFLAQACMLFININININ